MKFTDQIFPFLETQLAAGRRTALVTLVNIEGSAPRPIGSQMGISENGESVGLITGGCAEKSIIAEAQGCIKAGANKLIRYGKGSPYFDVQLPCGSGIDVYIEVINTAEITKQVVDAHRDRQSIYYLVDTEHTVSSLSDAKTSFQSNSFTVEFTLDPQHRILCFGEGTNLASVCSVASAAGLFVEAYTPDKNTLRYLHSVGIPSVEIHSNFAFDQIAFDRHSALVTTFHDHHWEADILHSALNSNLCYIGALGSRKTHAERLSILATRAPTQQPMTVIKGPVGLNIGASNPAEIAVAIIAEVIAHKPRNG